MAFNVSALAQYITQDEKIKATGSIFKNGKSFTLLSPLFGFRAGTHALHNVTAEVVFSNSTCLNTDTSSIVFTDKNIVVKPTNDRKSYCIGDLDGKYLSKYSSANPADSELKSGELLMSMNEEYAAQILKSSENLLWNGSLNGANTTVHGIYADLLNTSSSASTVILTATSATTFSVSSAYDAAVDMFNNSLHADVKLVDGIRLFLSPSDFTTLKLSIMTKFSGYAFAGENANDSFEIPGIPVIAEKMNYTGSKKLMTFVKENVYFAAQNAENPNQGINSVYDAGDDAVIWSYKGTLGGAVRFPQYCVVA